jgi:hypothetical protein
MGRKSANQKLKSQSCRGKVISLSFSLLNREVSIGCITVLVHLLRCNSAEVKYFPAYGLSVFALYWALSGLILTDIYPPVEVVRKYGDSKFPRYDPGGQNMTERLSYLAQTLMVLYDGDGRYVKRMLSPD